MLPQVFALGKFPCVYWMFGLGVKPHGGGRGAPVVNARIVSNLQ